MQKVTVDDGTDIAFHQSGTGAPLLLVHGSSADHTRWLPILPALERHFTVYAMDRRGRGASGDTEPYSIQREFEDIAAVIETIGGNVNVIAHSFGAFCALEAALLTPHLRKLVLYEPPLPKITGAASPDSIAKIQAFLESGDREAVVHTFLLEIAKMPPATVNMLRTHPTWQARVAAAHTLLREPQSLEALPPLRDERFQALKTPTLLLLGGESPLFYRESIEKIHAMLANSKIVVLPGQQHVAMNSAPDLFVQAVLKFLLD